MRRFPFSFVAIITLLTLSLSVIAQPVQSVFAEASLAGHFRPRTTAVSPAQPVTVDGTVPTPRLKAKGLDISRLSRKDFERWKAIEKVVLAEGKNGAALHPNLRALWQWAETSGQQIYIQMISAPAFQSNLAGSLNIEQFDHTGKCQVVVIKLYLSNIDQVVISPRTARANGFIPFENLGKEERYAEVFGHELAHAQYILSNLLRTHLVYELIETTNDLVLVRARRNANELKSPDMLIRLLQRDELLKEMEAQAEKVEEKIWQEISASQKTRIGSLTNRQH